MKRLLFLFAALLLLPTAGSAQTWVFDSDFPMQTNRRASSAHGIAVDGEGKVWIQYFGATERIIHNGVARSTNVVYVFNPDGSEASFSPVKFVQNGATRDTLGVFTNATGAAEGRSGRGMGVDGDGNILISQFDTIFKVDSRSSVNTTDSTVVGIAKVNPFGGASLTMVGADDANNVYVTSVVPGNPIRIYNPTLTSFEVASLPARGFNRSVLASPDGLNVFRFDYTTPYTTVFSRADEFSSFDSLGVTMRGFRTESAGIQPTAGKLWFAAGSPNDLPNQDPAAVTWWIPETWYGFDLDELVNYTSGAPSSTIEVPVPSDSLRWANTLGVGRPRGIGFSPNGLSAYIGEFSQPAPSAQKQTKTGTIAVEPGAPGVPEVASLAQNSPNPFGAATTISFGIETAAHVRLRVLDTSGREVGMLVDESLTAGNYNAPFDSNGLAAGVYVYVLEVDGRPMSRRMLVVR